MAENVILDPSDATDVYASGIGMAEITKRDAGTRPPKTERGRDLYIFQDTNGRIKIGRSGNPQKRRRNLETASGKKLITIAVFPGRGGEEQAVMAAVARYRGTGEWFDPSSACRKTIEAAVGCELKWPTPPPQYLANWRKEQERTKLEAMAQAYVQKLEATARRPLRRLADGAADPKRAAVREAWRVENS